MFISESSVVARWKLEQAMLANAIYSLLFSPSINTGYFFFLYTSIAVYWYEHMSYLAVQLKFHCAILDNGPIPP